MTQPDVAFPESSPSEPVDRAFPAPAIRERLSNPDVLSYYLDAGAQPWLADLLSRRMESAVGMDDLIQPPLSKIADPVGISDMDRAVERIVRAILRRERVVFACDHDMDGTASAAILWLAFTRHFNVDADLLSTVTSHRVNEGYGITEPVARRILEIKPHLVISADKGSSDELRIAMLAAAGIDVIVTDHHAIPPGGPPRSAYAVVSPIREESNYDRNICGAAVAFLTMAKVRSALIDNGAAQIIPALTSLLDIVAAATIADCVAMRPDKSFINRAFVKRGLEQINQRQRACWIAFSEQLHGPVDSETVAFRLVPAIAAAGRLDWADAGFKFLVTDSVDEARRHWNTLQSENTQRKALEASVRKRAVELALRTNGQSIIVFLSDGHSGVHGISASRLVEAFGRPTGIFSPRGAGARINPDGANVSHAEGLATGSFRSIPGLNIRDVLESVANAHPGLMKSWGGHPAAAGVSLHLDQLATFAAAFEAAVVAKIGSEPLQPVIWTDGIWPEELLIPETLDVLETLDPWGKDFPSPTLIGLFDVLSTKPVGNGTHLKCILRMKAMSIDAMWFNAIAREGDPYPLHRGTRAWLAYRLKANWFKGIRSLQLEIVRKCPDV